MYQQQNQQIPQQYNQQGYVDPNQGTKRRRDEFPDRRVRARVHGEDGGSIVCRVLTERGDAAMLIGKGGETVKRVSKESQAWINFSSMPGLGQQVCTVKGSSQACGKAIELMAVEIRKQSDEKSEEVTLSLLVPENSVGRIVGKGGTTIKSIQTRHNVKLSLATQRYPTESGIPEQSIAITGTPEQVGEASTNVMSCVDYSNVNNYGAPVQDMGYGQYGGGGYASNYNPMFNQFQQHQAPPRIKRTGAEVKIKIAVRDPHVRAIIGKGGCNVKEISQSTGTSLSFSDGYGITLDGQSTQIGVVSGPLDPVIAALQMIINKVTEMRAQEPTPSNNYPTALQLVISNVQVGWIIGRGGSKIKDTCAESKARVSVSEEKFVAPDGTEENSLLIEGTARTVAAATTKIALQLSRWNPSK